MKTRYPLLLLALTGVAHAQFYAPDTEFHDIAQRTFPVEAARLLAWQRNLSGGNIVEVKFEIQTTPGRETVWMLRWLDAAGKALREKTVRYPESLLVEGPKYFREVFRQIAAEDWRAEGAAPDTAATAFWQGAELAGVSRLEAITAASKLLAEKPRLARAADASRMAGILAHGTLPILGNQLTIDSVSLSRSAAWLCIAESRLREPLDRAWPPILFLAGREQLASKLWQELPASSGEKRGAAERFWDFFLRQPSVKESFIFAAKRENRAAAMPALLYQASCDLLWAKAVAEIAEAVIGAPLPQRHFDYVPALSARAAQSPGGSAVEPAVRAWVEALTEFVPGPLDFDRYREALGAIGKSNEKDSNLEEFVRRHAPLNLSFQESNRGALTPVAHLTTRDLLGYGWEAGALQIGYRFAFLRSYGDAAREAQRIVELSFTSLHGVHPFFTRPGATAQHPLQDLARLEFVSSSSVQHRQLHQGPASLKGERWLKRDWLMKGGGNEQLEAMIVGGATDEALKRMVERMVAEGGQLAFVHLLANDQGRKFPAKLKELGLRPTIAAALPSFTIAQAELVEAGYRQHGDPFRYAQELERLGWETGVALNGHTGFEKYLEANAVASAKRYYAQIGEFVPNRIDFSNILGPERFTLAWLEDEAARAAALQDSATYSHSNLRLRATDAIIRGELDEARAVLDALIRRYPNSAAQDTKIRDYLASVPALVDAAHADHGRALDSFPHEWSWQLLQWALLKHARLSDEDAIRFLGAEKAPPENQLLIAALRRDKHAFEKLFANQREELPHHSRPLILRFRCDLLAISPPAEQPDLQPKGARPFKQFISELLTAPAAGEGAAKVFDIAQFSSADDAWAAIEALREFKPARVNSPQDQMRLFREWLAKRRAAAQAFEKAYAKDPRRWDARMLAVDSASQLAQFGDRTVDPAEKSTLEAVLAAPDASADAKGEAAFVLTTMAGAGVDPSSPPTLPRFHGAMSEYLEKYPQHRRAPQVAMMQLQLLDAMETPGADTILAKLAAHPNPEIAAQAKAAAEQRSRFAELKKTPIALKLTASDGAELDFAKLRGKVVLLDFWASWCGPCVAEAPHLVATYKNLRESGFTIVGVSLDEDRAEMEAAVKKLGLTWPQHFDGKGWQNEVAQQFGIHAIPATWLFDKHGLLRKTGVSGGELAAAVERLLAE